MRLFKTPAGTELPVMDIKGKEYLQVQWRLVWFREEHPLWTIATRFHESTETHAFVGCSILDELGRVIATAHKFEDKAGFPDYREKAETGSIGRALALIGYGTQFCADELEEGSRIADAPADRKPVVGRQTIVAEQPGARDGVPGIHTDSYRVPFGKFKQRSLEEIGPRELGNYVNYLEGTAEREGKPIQGQVQEFIRRASEFIGSFEASDISL